MLDAVDAETAGQTQGTLAQGELALVIKELAAALAACRVALATASDDLDLLVSGCERCAKS